MNSLHPEVSKYSNRENKSPDLFCEGCRAPSVPKNHHKASFWGVLFNNLYITWFKEVNFHPCHVKKTIGMFKTAC